MVDHPVCLLSPGVYGDIIQPHCVRSSTGSLEQLVPALTHNIPRFPKLSWMKFSGHFLELDSFSSFFFIPLSLSLSLSLSHTQSFSLARSPLLFRSLLPSPFPTSLWLLTHAAVGCRGGHYMSLLLSLFLSLSLFPPLPPSPPYSLSLALSCCHIPVV